MISTLCAQPTWMFDVPAATGFFKSLPGLDSETEVVECFPHSSAGIVTDNNADTGGHHAKLNILDPTVTPNLMESEGINWDFISHTRPFADALIMYNGHAGLGGNAIVPVRVPGRIEYPNLTDRRGL